jgi:hypothetical protein
MTPFSPEAAQAIVDVELVLLAWLVRSVPVGALVLMAAVVLAVSWLCSTETRIHAMHGGHARARAA